MNEQIFVIAQSLLSGICLLLAAYKVFPNTKKFDEEKLKEYNEWYSKFGKMFQILGFSLIIVSFFLIVMMFV